MIPGFEVPQLKTSTALKAWIGMCTTAVAVAALQGLFGVATFLLITGLVTNEVLETILRQEAVSARK